MEWRAETSRGLVRPENEDSWSVTCLSRNKSEIWLAMVADGIGGHEGGEIASSLAVKSISEFISNAFLEDKPGHVLREAIIYANGKILESSMNKDGIPGMGTTLTCAMIVQNGSKVYLGHIGDSRAYIVSNRQIRKITDDHSVSGELVRNGTITEEDAMRHPGRNILTAALGTQETVDVAIYTESLFPGDVVILCTDGLTGLVSSSEISEVATGCDRDEAARRLVDLANSRGGYDNVTVVLLWPGAKQARKALRGEVG
ncbi:MAG: Stp1/IreP family PP2C-type Ser/Thr phosphatase [Bacillota bacterium]